MSRPAKASDAISDLKKLGAGFLHGSHDIGDGPEIEVSEALGRRMLISALEQAATELDDPVPANWQFSSREDERNVWAARSILEKIVNREIDRIYDELAAQRFWYGIASGTDILADDPPEGTIAGEEVPMAGPTQSIGEST